MDADLLAVRALDPSDSRATEVLVAGPAALVVAKVHKIVDRLDGRRLDRVVDKDALDVLRLLRVSGPDLVARMRRLLEHETSRPVTSRALDMLARRGATEDSEMAQMAARAARYDEDPDTVARAFASLVQRLLAGTNREESPWPGSRV